MQVLIAAFILAGVYVLIIFEVCTLTQLKLTTHSPKDTHTRVMQTGVFSAVQWVHRAMAAMLGSTAALAVLSMLQQVSGRVCVSPSGAEAE